MTQDEKLRERHNTMRNVLTGAGAAAVAAGLHPAMHGHTGKRMIQAGAVLGLVGLKGHYDEKVVKNDIRNRRMPKHNKEVAEGRRQAAIGYGVAGAGTILGFHHKITNGGKLVKYAHAALTAGGLAYGTHGQIKKNNHS
jgi:hypothetical protein